MGGPSFADGLGKVLALPKGDGQEDGHHQGGEQLQVVGVQAQPQNDLDDHVVDDGPDDGGQQLQGEVVENSAQQHLPDDDGGQSDDNGAPAHVDGGAALVLGQQGPGQGHQAVGEHQAQHLGGVGVDPLGSGHAGVGAGGPEGAAQLGAEKPVQHGDDGRH